MKVKIDQEFSSLCPPLTDDEITRLEQVIIETPDSLPPVEVWDNGHIVLDGHHRERLFKKHGLTPKYRLLKFGSRDEARNHVIECQLSRRNVNEKTREYLIGKLVLSVRKTHGGNHKADQVTNLSLDKIAEENRISYRDALRKALLAESIDTIREDAPELAGAILTGDVKASASDIQAVAEMSPAKRKRAAKKISDGAKVKDTVEELSAPKEDEAEVTVEDKMSDWNKDIEAWCRRLTGEIAKSIPDGPLMDANSKNAIIGHLKAAAGSARGRKGVAVCPKCAGQGCKTCRDGGYVDKIVYDSMPRAQK